MNLIEELIIGTRLCRHPEIRSSRRRSSTLDFPPLTGRRSSLAFRKSDQLTVEPNLRRASLFEVRINGEVSRTMRNLIVKVSSILLVYTFTMIIYLSSMTISMKQL